MGRFETTAFVKNTKSDFKTHIAYRNFLNSMRSASAKRSYSLYLCKFLSLPQYESKDMDQILTTNPRVLEADIIEQILEMKDKEGLSTSTLSQYLASLMHFFSINDVILNRKKISKFVGENVNKYEYRSYTTEEISKLLSLQDERGRAVILLMASTGMRIGALPDIKLKHLKRWNIDNQGNHVYQITVYANSPKDKYSAFCSPECAKSIDEYLQMRKRFGESSLTVDHENGNWTPGDSYLITRQFDKSQLLPFTNSIRSKKPIHKQTLAGQIIVSKLIQLGLRDKTISTETMSLSDCAKIRHELHPCHSLRIFAVTQMQRSKLDKTIREMLVGHSTGLDKVYYKPQDEEILQEYLKAVDLLTINNENRLQKQVDFYKMRADSLAEMAQRVQRLEEKWAGN